MKFLFCGLGNIGDEYQHTRHNIGFIIADAFARKHQTVYTSERYAHVARCSVKGKQVILVKPTTYMNLSGKAYRYWLESEKVKTENSMVLVDDLAIDFGKIRIRKNGSDAGHNGLKNIQELLQTQQYPRLRFGIGNNFPKGRQIEYVLGQWTKEEEKELMVLVDKSIEALESFIINGIDRTMNIFNK